MSWKFGGIGLWVGFIPLIDMQMFYLNIILWLTAVMEKSMQSHKIFPWEPLGYNNIISISMDGNNFKSQNYKSLSLWKANSTL